MLGERRSDVHFVFETKRRLEEFGSDISVEGYDLYEARRSDLADDKAGGGIAAYTRNTEGLNICEQHPKILDPSDAFVNTERMWFTVESTNTKGSKTAVCGAYAGCQHSED